MRKILLFPALLIICSAATAGEGSQANVTANPHVGGMFPHFSPGAANNNSSSPADLRLVAKTYSVYKDAGFMPHDSTTYEYSANRGGVPNPDNLNNDEHILFDVSTNYKFNPSILGYQNDKQRLQEFTGKMVDELIYKKWHPLTATWKNAERYLYMYDNSGKMQNSVLQLWYANLWSQSMYSTLDYDNNNNVVKMNSNTYSVDFVYDNNNNLVRIEDKVRTSGSTWTSSERKNYTYVGKNVVEYTLEKWDNGVWKQETRWTYTYDQDSNVVLTTMYKWNGSSWVGETQNEYKYDNNRNKLEDIQKVWSGGMFVNEKKETVVYNAKSLPETVVTHSWTAQGWKHITGDEKIHYYYEQYDPMSVPAFASGTQMNVYPVPASDNLHITINRASRQDFNITLMDMSGRIVYTGFVRDRQHYNASIPVYNLASGNYILSVSASDGNTRQKVTISH